MVCGVFLRAVNVGKHNRIRMDALRSLVEGVGYRAVRTRLQTGNVVLESDEPATVVAERLEAALTGAGLRGAAAMVYEVRGATFVAFGSDAVLAVIPRESPRPVNANALVESLWRTQATTRWWNVVAELRRDLLP